MTPKMWLYFLRFMSLLGTFGIVLAASPLPWPRLIVLFAQLVMVVLMNMGIAVISSEKYRQRESAKAVVDHSGHTGR